MNVPGHIATSLVASSFLGYFLKSWQAAAACLVGGILIDLDHLLDYCLHKKKMCWRYKDLYDYCIEEKQGRHYEIFHSYELLLILWLLILYTWFNEIFFGFVFGMTVHILFDQLVNDVYPLAYFLICRMKYGFPKKIFHLDDFLRDFKGREG